MIRLSQWRCSAQDSRIMINPLSIAAIYRYQSLIREANGDDGPELTQIALNNGVVYDVWETIDEIYVMLEQTQ